MTLKDKFKLGREFLKEGSVSKADCFLEVNRYITDPTIQLNDNSLAKSSGVAFQYSAIINHFGIDQEVNRLREIRAQRAAFSAIAGKDLSSSLKNIKDTATALEFPNPRAKNTAFAKLRAANDKSTKREA